MWNGYKLSLSLWLRQAILSLKIYRYLVGLSTGLARQDKGAAALAAILSMLITNATIRTVLKLTDKLATENLASVGQGMCLGIQTLETGVFGGILVGLMVYCIHEKFYKVNLPPYLGFFSGSRFVPIVCSGASIFLGIFLYLVWPGFQAIILGVGEMFKDTGYIGTLIYGFILRMLGLIRTAPRFLFTILDNGIRRK